jgi:hypothetical protein
MLVALGREGTTDEDVFPVWMRKRFGAMQGQQGEWDLGPMAPPQILARVDRSLQQPNLPFRPGVKNMFMLKARKSVCRTCNGGWMSDLQKSNRDVLWSMIEAPRVLTRDEAQGVATWATMTGITSEMAGHVVLDAGRRVFLREHLTPAPGTWVFTMFFDEPPSVLFGTQAFGVVPDLPIRGQHFGFDHLGFLVMQGRFTPQQRYRARVFSSLGNVGRLWPLAVDTNDIAWPPPFPVRHERLWSLMEDISRGVERRPGSR